MYSGYPSPYPPQYAQPPPPPQFQPQPQPQLPSQSPPPTGSSYESRCSVFFAVTIILLGVLGGLGYLGYWLIERYYISSSSSSSSSFSSASAFSSSSSSSSSTGGGGSSVVRPALDSTALLYLSASSFTAGEALSNWTDLSPAQNTFVQSQTSLQPITDFQASTNYIGVTFSGTQYMSATYNTFPTFSSSSSGPSGDYTIMAVVYLSNECVLTSCIFVGSLNTGHSLEATLYDTGSAEIVIDMGGTILVNEDTVVLEYNTITLLEFEFDSSASSGQYYINGRDGGTASFGGSGQSENDVYLGGMTTITSGGSGGNGQVGRITTSSPSLVGSLYEVLIWNVVLNTTYRQAWENYLMTEYALG